MEGLDPANWRLPVLRPLLPSAELIRPYLERIDERRIYSNLGPLSNELEGRIATLVGGGVRVAVASSGSLALTCAIVAAAGRASPEKPLAAMPSYTFIATALATQACGYEPLIFDVRPEDYQLDPSSVESHAQVERIGLVVPVAPYGDPVDQLEWSAFKDRTGIPVVIDGAASLDRVVASPSDTTGEIPLAVSLHATKSYGIGEGGAVVSSSTRFVDRFARAGNFDFSGTRETSAWAINAKMSEYAAAIGLAVFDGWVASQARYEIVAGLYREAFVRRGLAQRLVATPEVGASYVLMECRDADEAQSVCQALTDKRIGHRLWYGLGLHRMPLYRSDPERRLPVTDDLAPRLVGIPNAPDLTRAQIRLVADTVAASVG